jgi:Tfp pilus assembly protein PilO
MSIAITQQQLIAIANIIRGWPVTEKLTWDSICLHAKMELDFIPTRQALANKAIIVNAYKSKKTELKARANTLSSIPTPKSMNAAVETIIRLRKENELLKSELSAMAEVAQLFIHNAYLLHGMTKAQLMKPILKISRKDL